MIRLLMMIILLMGASCLQERSLYAETVRFAPLPMENKETVVKQFRPMTTYLENRLKITIAYVYSDSYADILAKFKQSQVDLAYLGPLPYVQLRAVFSQALPIVHFREKSGASTYTCSLITFPDALFEIKGAHKRKIALTQPLSTCGYLSVSGLMRKGGGSIEANQYRYIGKHDKVALSVVRGDFDAGGLKTAIARKYMHLGIDILAETPPMPAFALVANTEKLSPALISRIRDALINLDPHGKDEKLLQSWGDNIRYGAVVAGDDDYKAVRDLLNDAVIPEKGNF